MSVSGSKMTPEAHPCVPLNGTFCEKPKCPVCGEIMNSDFPPEYWGGQQFWHARHPECGTYFEGTLVGGGGGPYKMQWVNKNAIDRERKRVLAGLRTKIAEFEKTLTKDEAYWFKEARKWGWQ